MENNQTELSKIKLLSGLSPSSLQILAGVASKAHFNVGEYLLFEKDENTSIFFICEGAVRIFRTNPEGREQTLINLNAGEVFNLPTAFLKSGKSPASAKAVQPVTAIRIGPAEFRKIVSENLEIALAVLGDLSEKMEYLTNLVHDVSLRSVKARLAKFLLDPMHHQKDLPRWTHEAMAARLGTTREVISRMIRQLVQEGLIRTDRHCILITDPERLKAESQD